MPQNIKKTLQEARSAYRFLYSYQKRILDLVSYIGGKYGFRYDAGYTKFSAPAPRDGRKGDLTRWSWDWLTLYYHEFHFEGKTIGEDTIRFSIFVLNDTGFFDAREEAEEGKGVSKTNTNSFKSVEESRSELIFVAGKNEWEGWGYDWDNPEFVSQVSGEKETENNGLMVFKHYSLESFENEQKAMAQIKDFQKLCTERNIEFKITEKPFEKGM